MSNPVTPQMVKQLRDRTDQPMGLCQKALVQAAGDMDKAIDWLRSQNKNMGAVREGNETAEGRIGVYLDPATKTAAIVEMRCESAPSAKSDQFIALANDLAKHVAENKPTSVAEALTQPFGKGTIADRINDVVGVIREKMILQRFQRLEGGLYGSYVHHDGTVGVILECSGTGGGEVIRDVATHIAALNPPYANVAAVPADVVAKEKDAVKAEMDVDPKSQGKPANILEKIAEGKLKTRLAESVLTEQQMANGEKYPKMTVGAALQKAGVEAVKFVRFKVGGLS
jgi:elongation factor Ts